MKLIILRVPEKTTLQQVKSEVTKKLSEKFTLPVIGKKPRLVSAKILEHTDAQGIKEYYAVIEVDSNKTGRWLMRKCKSFKVCNKNCYFREYFDRMRKTTVSIENDRRAGSSIEDKVDTHVEGLGSFSRKHF